MKLVNWLPAAFLGGALGLGVAPALALQGKVVGTGFDEPLFVTAPKDDKRLFVVEKGGVIKIAKGNQLKTFLDISDRVNKDGERGLLGLAFDPGYASNGRFYVNYIDADGSHTVVERYTVSPPDANKADRSSRQRIIAIPQESFSNHKAGWIGFRRGDRAHLYIAVGDGGSGYDPDNNAQNGKVLLGKMLRLDVSGSKAGYRIPDDNPFVNDDEVRDEIWALGLRNPFRASFDRRTGDFWIGDVGQDSREEVDFEKAGDPGGHNYGWRLREGFIRTPGDVGGDKPGLTDPVYDYPHSGQDSFGSCITGGYVYRGPSIPEADGRYFYGDCVSDRAASYNPTPDGKPTDIRDDTGDLVAGTGLSILASFGEDSRGRLYLVGLNGVVVAMCPGSAAAGRQAPANVKGQPRLLANVVDPCAD